MCFLPTSARPKRSMVAGDAGFSFLPSYRPCQPEAPCSLPCSPLHPRNLTCACTGEAVQGQAGWHEGQESTGHRRHEDQVLTAGHVSWPPDTTPPRNIAPAGLYSQLDVIGTLIHAFSLRLVPQNADTGCKDPLSTCAPQPHTH